MFSDSSILQIVGRNHKLLDADLSAHSNEFDKLVKSGKFLVIGGAGSIGKEVVKQIFRRNPRVLHVVDISENNLTELVRDLRSSVGYSDGETEFYPIDYTSPEFEQLLSHQKYDYILNLAAMKHVRSEKHTFSLVRMINTNIVGVLKSMQIAAKQSSIKYFAVSTDKAKNPANLMGATKYIMEDVMFTQVPGIQASSARFANVAFSDGSLLHSFNERLQKRQPIAAPRDVKRYFLIPQESGEICLFSLFLGNDKEIFFPKLKDELKLTTFSEIAKRFLIANGYEPVEVASEDEARSSVNDLRLKKKWPCYFFDSDTTGEKPFEEFFSDTDDVDMKRLNDLGVIRWKDEANQTSQRVEEFLQMYRKILSTGNWKREDFVNLISKACPHIQYKHTGKFLDQKM